MISKISSHSYTLQILISYPLDPSGNLWFTHLIIKHGGSFQFVFCKRLQFTRSAIPQFRISYGIFRCFPIFSYGKSPFFMAIPQFRISFFPRFPRFPRTGGDFGPRQGRRRSAGRHGGDPRGGTLRGACAAAAAGAAGPTVEPPGGWWRYGGYFYKGTIVNSTLPSGELPHFAMENHHAINAL